MSQEQPSQPNPNSSEAQSYPSSEPPPSADALGSRPVESEPLEASSEKVALESQELSMVEGAEDLASPPIESTSEVEPEPQPISPADSSPPPQPPQVKSQTLQTLQQFWQTAQPKLKAGAIATYKGAIYVGRALLVGGQKFWAWWNRVLPKIRGLLPASLQTQLPDIVLTGAIATILIFLLWLTPSLLFSKPRPQVATTPPSPTLPAPPQPTPEQPPIAQIQDQVAEVSNQYGNGLIQSVQANFRASRLTVNVSDGWYGLAETQQGKLANDILKRAQQLNFMKLELIDSEGTLLARSPVVGPEMVILRPTKVITSQDEMAG